MTRRQRGIALIALLAILAIGASAFLIRQLNVQSGGMEAIRKNRNAEVLNRAKQALIGYVALRAAQSNEDNPGRLPCPEAAGYFDNPSQEGQAAGACTLPKVGRFPWRTIGTDKLVDASGEPLWYVVSPGWALTSGNTLINSNTTGQLTVDGVAGSAVALIIAPGPAFAVPAAAGCTAWNQVRPTTGTPNWRNYLECDNATWPTPDASFVTTGPSGSFNDQVVRITVADVMPAIEAAIAHRIEREIVPQLKAAYASSAWGLSSANPLYPFPAPFSNPGASSFQGGASSVQTDGSYAGLLPVVFSRVAGSSTACTPATGSACDPTFVAWQSSPVPSLTQTGGAALYSAVCSVATVSSFTQIGCTLYIYSTKNARSASMNFTLQGTAQNVARAMRSLDTSVTMAGISTTPSASAVLNNDASATVTLTASIPQGPLDLSNRVSNGNCQPGSSFSPATHDCFRMTIAVPVSLLADHAIIDASSATYGWFMRNEWYRLAYYAVAAGYTAAARPATPNCTTPSTCLSVANLAPAGSQRAILILAGRNIVSGSARPSGTLTDYLEFGNATGVFERQPVNVSVAAGPKNPFNDRIVVIDSN